MGKLDRTKFINTSLPLMIGVYPSNCLILLLNPILNHFLIFVIQFSKDHWDCQIEKGVRTNITGEKL
jgi:hypothetical protein